MNLDHTRCGRAPLSLTFPSYLVSYKIDPCPSRYDHNVTSILSMCNAAGWSGLLHSLQEFSEERTHIVSQHAAEIQEIRDIIAAVEVGKVFIMTC